MKITFSQVLADFSSPMMLKAVAVGMLVSLCAAMLGVILVLKRYSLIGHGLGEVGFASATIAGLIGLSDYSLAVSIPLVTLSSILIMRFDRKSGMGGDVLIGIFSTAALAVGVIASYYTTGYTGDIICSDCGALVEQGAVIVLGGTVSVPKNFISQIGGLFTALFNGILNTLGSVFESIFPNGIPKIEIKFNLPL